MRKPMPAAFFALVGALLVFAPSAIAQQEQYAEEPVEQRVEEQLQEEVGAPVDVTLSEEAAEQIRAAEEQLGAPVQVDVAQPIQEQLQQTEGTPEITVGDVQQPQAAPQPAAKGQPAPEGQAKAGQAKAAQTVQMPKTGGPSPGALLLPVAALLAGSGVLAYAIVRRRRR